MLLYGCCQGALPALLHLLQVHGEHEQLAAAVLELFVLASKAPRRAMRLLLRQQLVQLLQRMLTAHEASPSVCGPALKCLRRLAKQPTCRDLLIDAGALPLLVGTAQRLAAVPSQQQQVKVGNASRCRVLG